MQSFAIFDQFLPFRWGLVVSVFSHFLLAWFLRGFSQWFFTRRIPKVPRHATLVDLKKNVLVMLQNASFLAIVAVDTEENEPSKVRQLDS